MTQLSISQYLEPTLSLEAERTDLSWIFKLPNMFIISDRRSYMKPSSILTVALAAAGHIHDHWTGS
jgi:hypothetical protein